METSLMSLPSEILSIILAHLSVPSLLEFSATCRTNQMLAHRALTNLNLAILPSEVHCSMALISKQFHKRDEHFHTNDILDTYQTSVSRTTNTPVRPSSSPKDASPTKQLAQQITAQNDIASEILSKSSLKNLRSLSLHMYDFQSAELASIMATNLTRLRHLSLNFSHPYIHDQSLPSSYWLEASSGTAAWNPLVGLGQTNQQKLRLRGLLSLHIERAGLTSTQLRKFIEANPYLRRIYLDNVTGVDQEFVRWLATYCESGKSRIDEVRLERCPGLKMQCWDDFAWLTGIVDGGVRCLSLWRCRNVRDDMLVRLIEREEDEDEEDGLGLELLETLIPPKGFTRRFGIADELMRVERSVSAVLMQTGLGSMEKIDVDPEYLCLSAAA